MKRGIFVVLAALMCGCASQGPMAAAKNGEAVLSSEYFSSQERCFNAWQALVDEWITGGGGIRSTISDTRRLIAQDKRTQLSRLFRDAWKKQSSASAGQWKSFRATALAFESIVTDEVPSGCGSIVWLQPLLVETPGVFAEGAKEALLAEAPVDAREDSRTFSMWLTYMLLAPVDYSEQNKNGSNG